MTGSRALDLRGLSKVYDNGFKALNDVSLKVKKGEIIASSLMSTGQVKWFNNAKGFGFILPDEGGDDLFAHYSAIGMEGYKTLKAGQLVSFDTIEGPKGLHAANIHAVADAPAANGEQESDTDATAEDNADNAVVEEEILT